MLQKMRNDIAMCHYSRRATVFRLDSKTLLGFIYIGTGQKLNVECTLLCPNGPKYSFNIDESSKANERRALTAYCPKVCIYCDKEVR